MSRDTVRSRILCLTVFPLLQLVLYVAACYLATVSLSSGLVGMLACVLGSGLALNFTIHICVHELLHYSDRHPLPVWANVAVSLVAGVSLDGYRFHHHNHHRCNNGPDDFSRTWRMTSKGPLGYALWYYALGWPVQVKRTVACLRAIDPLPRYLKALRRRMRYESCSIVTLLVLLVACDWRFALLYMAMVYIGWTLVSVHNYGQHPPQSSAETTSYSLGRWYNRLFFNNGLHYEHHADPVKPWFALRPDSNAPQIARPHLVSPFWRSTQPSSGRTDAGLPSHKGRSTDRRSSAQAARSSE